MKKKVSKVKTATGSANGGGELLDEIESVLFKARSAQRPFVEYLLYMAFVEELKAPRTQKKHRNGTRR